MKKYVLILSVSFSAICLVNGSNNIDSLVEFSSNTDDDLLKAKTLFELTESCPINDIGKYAVPLIELTNSMLRVANENKLETIKYYKAQAHNNLGYMYKIQGLIHKALENFYASIKISESLHDTLGMANTYSNIASTLDQQGDREKAYQLFYKSLDLYTALKDDEGIGIIYNNLGQLYEVDGNYTKSIEFYVRSIAIWEKLDLYKYKGYALNNIGVNLDHLGQSDSALVNFNQALSHFEKENNLEDIAWTCNLIGGVYLDRRELKQAEYFLLKGYDISDSLILLETRKNICSNLYELYQFEQEYQKAFKFYTLFIALNDSLHNEETQKTAVKQQARYEYEKQKAIDDAEHEKQLAIEQEAKEKQQILTFATAGGLGLVGIFLIFVFNRLKVTRRQKVEIEEAHDELEEKNREILDSINYAKRIQSAILPPDKIVKEYLQNSFILYKPKDIVAGDFYWMETLKSDEHREMSDGEIGPKSQNPKLNTQHTTLRTQQQTTGNRQPNVILFAAADCTGHGVPGAMVSVVCNNGLNRAVREHGLSDPGLILDKTREIVVQEFEKSEEDVKDGMDIALCSLKTQTTNNKQQTTVEYAGANNPLWIIRKKESGASNQELGDYLSLTTDNYLLFEIKADKQPIGKHQDPKPYTTHTIELEQGDTIYIFSDGYADQFGGENGKKMKTANFKKLLLSIQNENMEAQQNLINEAFENWKGTLEQLDDVCIIGVRL